MGTDLAERFGRQRMVEEAVATTGLDDFGAAGWEEGLDRLLDSFAAEAQLNDLGVEIAAGDVQSYLVNRLRLVAWRAAHPAVAGGAITQPIVIVGQPRTGTTILYDLLAQDPALRAPRTWEVDHPVPPPTTATRAADPRIAEVEEKLAMTDLLVPGFRDFHPLGALLAQECVRITGHDFKSLIFSTQYRTPTYDRWLLHEADMASAYAFHRQFLEHLQSEDPADQWLLKSPAHLWCLDALAAEYPDAVVVQSHRDPLKVIASISALVTHLRQMTTDAPSVAEAAADWSETILDGLERGMAARDAGAFPASKVIDLQFRDFITDPFATIGAVYDAMGRELTPEAEGAMREFLATHPGDGGGGGTRYRWADTGLDADELRERVAPYQERFGVPSEEVR
jgi:hypothetical protein